MWYYSFIKRTSFFQALVSKCLHEIAHNSSTYASYASFNSTAALAHYGSASAVAAAAAVAATGANGTDGLNSSDPNAQIPTGKHLGTSINDVTYEYIETKSVATKILL